MAQQKLIQVPFPPNTRYQTIVIPAGGRATIYFFGNWGTGWRAFIDQVALGPDALPWNLIQFLWFIDGGAVDTFQYQIAPINMPKHFEPPFLARNNIRWDGINNDPVNAHLLEVVCDGILVKEDK